MAMLHRGLVTLAALALGTACGVGVFSDEGEEVGSDGEEAASSDGGRADAGRQDGGRSDAGQPDAGAGDAGGRRDGGQWPDAGRSDAGSADVGEDDAGGHLDGGERPDAGRQDGGGPDAGKPDAGGADAGGPCDFSDPPANVAAWINESWNAQLKSNLSGRKDWLLDNVIKGNGVINLCIRWSATTKFTAAWRDQIASSMASWFNDWFEALGPYGCFPYPNGVTVNITGIAVKPGQESILEWSDRSIPVYTETDRNTDPPGEPKCPDNCSFFVNWDHSFPKCAAGEDMHFDYDVWLGDTLPGGAGAVGGDWGVRMPRASFTGELGQPTFNMIEHEMGHGFGMQDYYEWTGSRPSGGSVMIVGSAWGKPTVGDAWLLRRIWKEQKAMRGW